MSLTGAIPIALAHERWLSVVGRDHRNRSRARAIAEWAMITGIAEISAAVRLRNRFQANGCLAWAASHSFSEC